MSKGTSLHKRAEADSVLAGGGELGALMRAFNWTETPLGAVETWPQSLRSVLSMLLPSKAQIILFWGPEFIVFYNDAYRPVFGAKHPHALGRPGREAWSEIWNTVLHDLLAGVVRTGEAFWAKDLLFLIERHGFLEETYFDVSYDPVRVESGGVGGVYCIVTETTDRVVSARRISLLKDLAAGQTAARTSRDAYVLAMEGLAARPQDIVFALAYEDDELQSCTPGARQMRAATKPELVLELPIYSPGSTDRPGRLVVGLNPKRPFDEQYRAFLELVASQLGSALANTRAYEEERKRAEALAEIDRAKTAFFSNVSHEFRTPLTLILGPVEDILTESAARPNGERQRIELVHRNSLRLLKLVNTLLDFSRIEAGRVEAVFRPTELDALTGDLASAFRSAIERAGMELVVDCPPLREPAYVDRDMWEKIVLNLLSNAFKYTLEGRIIVRLRQRGASIALDVTDTGVGIPEHEITHIFERFHRVEGSEGRTHEGTGIGLSLVQELVRLHSGSVSVVSEPGVGSTFTVVIPAGNAHLSADRIDAARTLAPTALGATPFVEEALRWLPDAANEVPVSEIIDAVVTPVVQSLPESGARARVLLADDNADMRDYVQRLLSAQYEVESVPDGASALTAARRRRPDLILADVMMPSLDGFGLLRELRKDPDLSAIPVVLLSARAGEEARVEGWGAGADDYLVKPFSARELLARVEAHLKLVSVRQEAAKALQLSLEAEQQARTEAQHASRVKDEFLTMLSHELRTPLNAILGWSQILTGRTKPSADTLQQGLETIERNSRIQVQLIEDLLDISRITEGKLRLDVKQVALADIVMLALDSIRPAADAKQIRIQTMLDCESDHVNGDPARLQQIVWNLLSNAVKFTPKGGRIQVLLERVNSHTSLTVSDTGEGIPLDFLPHVFDRFRQADQSTTRAYGGLGLGLSIVKHLVELHGGTVRAKSAGKGQGSSFIVDLPLRLHRQTDAAGAIEERTPASLEALGADTARLEGITVLYVDDEPDARELAGRVLSMQGARVITADSAVTGRQLMLAERPDVLVADIGMPEEDGYALIHSVRALPADRGGSIPAAAVTALARAEDRRRALLAGFQTHVAKPVDIVELVAVVASLVGRTGR